MYRRDIDGLRAMAVVPVIISHSGLGLFAGGHLGVDIFFVISGFLITGIILGELERGEFSLVRFYERRARRILPALFLVIGCSLPFAYLWMMPDEFKNFGQSVAATALFSNNILLAATSDYWALASEFKPLLHTWSLGVEEQYYLGFPLLLMVLWRANPRVIPPVLVAMLLASMAGSIALISSKPVFAFYLLPTRAWELLVGAIVAIAEAKGYPGRAGDRLAAVLSAAGFACTLAALLMLDASYATPGPSTLLPVVGTALIIAWTRSGTPVARLLGSAPMVGTGLISYSLYLWHQPILAFARIYARETPGPAITCALIGLTGVLSLISWRLVERPFRQRERVSFRTLAGLSVAAIAISTALGVYLDRTYGMYWRYFDRSIRIAEIDKRQYNQRVFRFKKDAFVLDDRLRIVVFGNSFGRDFVNMTVETFPTADLQLAYRDDLESCLATSGNAAVKALAGGADIIVLANGASADCIASDIRFAESAGKTIFLIGTKHFGSNLNWPIRMPVSRRANLVNRLPADTAKAEAHMRSLIPARNFISLLQPVLRGGKIPITDSRGRMLSVDRVHVTRFGAIYFGKRVLRPSAFGTAILKHAERMPD